MEAVLSMRFENASETECMRFQNASETECTIFTKIEAMRDVVMSDDRLYENIFAIVRRTGMCGTMSASQLDTEVGKYYRILERVIDEKQILGYSEKSSISTNNFIIAAMTHLNKLLAMCIDGLTECQKYHLKCVIKLVSCYVADYSIGYTPAVDIGPKHSLTVMDKYQAATKCIDFDDKFYGNYAQEITEFVKLLDTKQTNELSKEFCMHYNYNPSTDEPLEDAFTDSRYRENLLRYVNERGNVLFPKIKQMIEEGKIK